MVSKPTIVHIEDDPNMIVLVGMILSEELYTIHSCTNGKDALPLLQQLRPNLILLDIMLPDMNGWDIYEFIRSDVNLQHTPVIVITAQNKPIDRAFGEHLAKVDKYLTKPFRANQLREAVTEILR